MKLRELQQSIADSVRGVETSITDSGISVETDFKQRLAIYQNHYLISLIDAITTTFPATRHYLGEQDFNNYARQFVVTQPPESGCLADYGERFPDWLQGAEPEAAELAAFEWSLERVGMSPLPNSFPFDKLAKLGTDHYEKVYFKLARGVCLFEAKHDVAGLFDQIKNSQALNKDSYSPGRFYWVLYRKSDGVGVYPADIIFTGVITLCQSGQSLSMLGNALTPAHIQAIFFMVEKGIIDGFEISAT